MSKSGFPAADTYRFIVDWAIAHKGNTPSLKQIGDALGVAPATVFYHVRALVERGVLERIDGDLCVTRLIVTAPDNIYYLNAPERSYPEIEKMLVIPKEVTLGRSTLDGMGINPIDVLDEEFMTASYPPFWKFAKINSINGVETYQLLDEGNVTRAILTYDLVNYKASIHFWG